MYSISRIMTSFPALSIGLLLLALLGAIVCPPVSEKPPPKPAEENKEEETGTENLEYDRYLREVVSVLESDETFKKKLEEANISDIKSGEIAKHLDFVGHGIRTQLDEIKRKEIDRLRQVMRLRSHLQKGMMKMHPDIQLPGIDKENVMGHMDHNNPNSFEVDDLAKLIKKATKDLEEVDRKRREEFKAYEMEKEHLRKKELEAMDELARAEAERKHREQEKKHEDHPKLHHPGNEAQLQEVWEESDGLNKKDFDPTTFFNLHDTNSDGVLDEAEIEALFQNELDKMYDPNAPEDDMMERYEEMNRMREHVMNEVDKNQDKLITLNEFIDSTKSKEFKKDEEWETLDKETVFSEEEFAQFEKQYEEHQRQRQPTHPTPPAHHGGAPVDHLGQQQQAHPAGGQAQVMHQQPIHDQQQQQQQQQQHPNDIQQQQQQQQEPVPQVQHDPGQPIVYHPVDAQPNVNQDGGVVHPDQGQAFDQQQQQQQGFVQQQEIQNAPNAPVS